MFFGLMNDIISRKDVRGCGKYNLDTIYYCAPLFNRLLIDSLYVCLTYRVKWFVFTNEARNIRMSVVIENVAFVKKEGINFIYSVYNVEM